MTAAPTPASTRDATACRAALLAAQGCYLHWLAHHADQQLEDRPKRSDFATLADATKKLTAALRRFPSQGGNRVRLLALLQAEERHTGTQRAYETRLQDVGEFLELLQSAARRECRGGLVADAKARAWMFTAADEWRARFSCKPSATERGRFWRTLAEMQTSRELSPRLPALTLKMLRRGLAEWADARGLVGAPKR